MLIMAKSTKVIIKRLRGLSAMEEPVLNLGSDDLIVNDCLP
jgi:hypothetical protein